LLIKKILPECNIAMISSKEIKCIKLKKTLTASAIQVNFNCNIIEFMKDIEIHIPIQSNLDIANPWYSKF
jgi:hypothetical protein